MDINLNASVLIVRFDIKVLLSVFALSLKIVDVLTFT
jgi:hypothetical protein